MRESTNNNVCARSIMFGTLRKEKGRREAPQCSHWGRAPSQMLPAALLPAAAQWRSCMQVWQQKPMLCREKERERERALQRGAPVISAVQAAAAAAAAGLLLLHWQRPALQQTLLSR